MNNANIHNNNLYNVLGPNTNNGGGGDECTCTQQDTYDNGDGTILLSDNKPLVLNEENNLLYLVLLNDDLNQRILSISKFGKITNGIGNTESLDCNVIGELNTFNSTGNNNFTILGKQNIINNTAASIENIYISDGEIYNQDAIKSVFFGNKSAGLEFNNFHPLNDSGILNNGNIQFGSTFLQNNLNPPSSVDSQNFIRHLTQSGISATQTQRFIDLYYPASNGFRVQFSFKFDVTMHIQTGPNAGDCCRFELFFNLCVNQDNGGNKNLVNPVALAGPYPQSITTNIPVDFNSGANDVGRIIVLHKGASLNTFVDSFRIDVSNSSNNNHRIEVFLQNATNDINYHVITEYNVMTSQI